MALIDTHALVEEMVAAGVKKDQAVIFTKAINQSNDNLVTKSDLKLEINKLRSEMSKMGHDLDTNLNWLKTIGLLLIGLGIKAAFFNS